MRPTLAIVAAVGCLLGASVARADEEKKPDEKSVPAAVMPAPEPEKKPDPAPAPSPSAPVDAATQSEPTPPPKKDGPKIQTTTNGFFDTRTTYTQLNLKTPVSNKDTPGLANISEAGLTLKLNWGDKAIVYSDVSFIWQGATCFQNNTTGWCGVGKSRPDHDVASLRPLAVVSELYALYHLNEHLNFTLGKKRIVWGPGFAFNPTDILNPPKDPTDPTFQRSGAWLARVELPYEKFTISLVAAAKVLRTYGGLPGAFLYYPDYPSSEQKAVLDATKATYSKPDTDPHFAAAARVYALLADTDFNLFYFFTNKYNDAFDHKSRFGASASHVFGALEVHFEGTLQFGKSNVYANPDCVKDLNALLTCGLAVQAGTAASTSIADASRTRDWTLVPKVVVGPRYQFDNNAILSLEYYYNGEGYDWYEFRDYLALARAASAFTNSTSGSLPFSLPGASANTDPGVPQKFAFNPLRRHYLFLSYQQPQINDDWTVSATVIVDAEDLSSTVAPYVAWNAQEWLTLTLGANVSIPGVSQLGVTLPADSLSFPVKVSLPKQTLTEFGLSPLAWQVYFAVRAFY
jgi:hypothetical protein